MEGDLEVGLEAWRLLSAFAPPVIQVPKGWFRLEQKTEKKKQNKRYDTANVGFVGFYGKPITEKHNY